MERQKNSLAQGRCSPLSKDASQFIRGISPTHINEPAHGCWFTATNGKKYLDFVAALGALSLGYGNQKVNEAAIRQIRKGISYSLPTTLEIEIAERLGVLIPSAEKFRFFKNGRDAADAAIRIARASTNRDLILSTGYHGCSDLFTSLTPPAAGIKDTFQIKSLESILDLERSKAAAVIIEAIYLDDSSEYQKQIQDLRKRCKESGIVFIIDEIITGFRYPKWTVSNAWALDPDIILLGKGMANGHPLSAIGGKRTLMDQNDYFFSTTFSGEAVSLAACQATLEELSTRSFDDLLFYGKRLQKKLNTLDPEIRFEGYGTRCMLNVSSEKTTLFMQEMHKAGIFIGKAHFFNFSHLEENIEEMVMATAESCIENIKQGRVKLEGARPLEVFKR